MKIHLDTNLLIQQPRWDLFPAGEHRLFVSAIAFAEFSECTTHPEPTISDRTEPLESIEIFPGSESDVAVADPETADQGHGDGPGDDDSSIFTEDLEEELNELEEEFGVLELVAA